MHGLLHPDDLALACTVQITSAYSTYCEQAQSSGGSQSCLARLRFRLFLIMTSVMNTTHQLWWTALHATALRSVRCCRHRHQAVEEEEQLLQKALQQQEEAV